MLNYLGYLVIAAVLSLMVIIHGIGEGYFKTKRGSTLAKASIVLCLIYIGIFIGFFEQMSESKAAIGPNYVKPPDNIYKKDWLLPPAQRSIDIPEKITVKVGAEEDFTLILSCKLKEEAKHAHKIFSDLKEFGSLKALLTHKMHVVHHSVWTSEDKTLKDNKKAQALITKLKAADFKVTLEKVQIETLS